MAIYNYNKIQTGGQPNDGTGDNIRDAFTKVNDNLDLLFTLGEGNVILTEIYNTLTYVTGVLATIPSNVSAAASTLYVDTNTSSVYNALSTAIVASTASVLATTATDSRLGVVKVGTGITRSADGTISVPVGPSGPSGPSGADSTVTGPSGVSGPSGPSGPSGADSTVTGPSGVSGPSGPSGPSGADSTVPGPSGPSGPVNGFSNPYSSAFTITNATQSTSTTTGALTVTGGVGIGGNLNVSGIFYESWGSYAATGTNQSTAVEITHNMAYVQYGTSGGVRLPAFQLGTRILLRNSASSSISVYPASGDEITGAGTTDLPITVSPYTILEFAAIYGGGTNIWFYTTW